MRSLALALLLAGDVALASAEAQAPRSPSPEDAAREALLAARAHCAKRGPALTAFIGGTFDAAWVASKVIDGWATLDASKRTAFIGLLDRVVGADQRAISTQLVCKRGARIESVRAIDATVVHVKLQAPGDDECTTLVLVPDGRRWVMSGVWYCGANAFYGDLRHWLGGGDYTKAVETLTLLTSRTRTPA